MDKRKSSILAAVVDEHISSTQPVGSKTVVSRGISYSPATVRNQMSELEEMGYLEQPHSSSGRVPTDLGFRYYVDNLLKDMGLYPDDKQAIDSLYNLKRMSSEELMEQTARSLSELSRQVAVALMVPVWATLKSVHFSESGKGMIRIVFHASGGLRQEKAIKNEWGLDKRSLSRLNNLISRIAPGRTLVGLRRELIRQLEQTRAQADLVLARAVELSEKMVDLERPGLIVKGQANLFEAPEFMERARLRELIRALEEKTMLIEMLEQSSLTAGTRVFIGGENSISELRCCSFITSTYRKADMPVGALGVIGPTRMNYTRLIPVVHYASELISECFRRYV